MLASDAPGYTLQGHPGQRLRGGARFVSFTSGGKRWVGVVAADD